MMTSRFRIRALTASVFLLAGLVTACEGASEPDTYALESLTPDRTPTAAAGTALTGAVRVVTPDGRPGADQAVTLVSSPGIVSPTTARSDATGNVAFTWTLRTTPGADTLRIALAGGTADTLRYVATVTAGSPASLTAASAQSQLGTVDGSAAILPVVLVKDAHGNPVAGATVSFTVSGGGVVTPTSVATDAAGRAALTSWRLGTSGTQSVIASVQGAAPVTFTATPAPTNGTIRVTATGLAADEQGTVTVRAVATGATQTLTLGNGATGSVTGPLGAYVVAGSPVTRTSVTAGAETFAPDTLRPTLTPSDSLLAVTLAYQRISGTVTVTGSGLPLATIVRGKLTGGGREYPFTTRVEDNLSYAVVIPNVIRGTYTATFEDVVVGGVRRSATPLAVTLGAGENVTAIAPYRAASGALIVAPEGLPADIAYGFEISPAGSTTPVLRRGYAVGAQVAGPLAPGRYTVLLHDAPNATTRYVPSPRVLTMDVAVGSTDTVKAAYTATTVALPSNGWLVVSVEGLPVGQAVQGSITNDAGYRQLMGDIHSGLSRTYDVPPGTYLLDFFHPSCTITGDLATVTITAGKMTPAAVTVSCGAAGRVTRTR